MKKIVCYRRGCNHQAQYEVPGRNGKLHLCRICLLDLYPDADMASRRMEVGPTEFKIEKDLNADSDRVEAQRLLAEARRLEHG